ncbi:SCO-spondin [Patella vulgata]|uniref:SCO-spondin n=1 Tax=Patella vulgata TaxID=6465 RepID=UPI0021803DE8|nr:SCO-spondin [Patella vulgata]
MKLTMDLVLVLSLLVVTVASSSGQTYITGDATCDNQMSFYADGVLYSNANDNNWPRSSPVSIPGDTQVVAVKCVDQGVVGGIKLALSNGIKTDATWKCSAKYEKGWNLPGFDDGAWENAILASYNWGSNPSSLNGKAEWIWTSGYRGEDLIVYCRRVIVVNGGWSDWSEWRSYGPCKACCGTGKIKQWRSRTCTNPAPGPGGAGCVGSSYQFRTADCLTGACKDRCPANTVKYFPYPGDRRRFCQCDNRVARPMNCAPGTVWNQKYWTCVHGSGCGSGILLTADQTDCTKFYKCVLGLPVGDAVSCPDGLAFNPYSGNCDFIASVLEC